MNNYNTETLFNEKLAVIKEHFTTITETEGFNWNEISAVLMLKIKKNWTLASSNSNYQLNSNNVVDFFPRLHMVDSHPHWRIGLKGKVHTANLRELGVQVGADDIWKEGNITHRHKLQNTYPYLQLTLEDDLRDLKNALSEDNQVFFLKRHKSDCYYILGTTTELFGDDSFLAIKPSLSHNDNSVYHLLPTNNFSSNIIYYGPPGTGKTRKIQMNHLEGRDTTNSKFITFHQSYSYEEFIEGLKPILGTKKEVVFSNSNLRQFIFDVFNRMIDKYGWNIREGETTNSTINNNPYTGIKLSSFFGSEKFIGKFNSAQTLDSLSSSGTKRYFETAIKEDESSFYYLTTQWADVIGTGLTFNGFNKFVISISSGEFELTNEEGDFKLVANLEDPSAVSYKVVKGVFYDACESAAKLAGYSSLKKCLEDDKPNRRRKMDKAVSEGNVFVMCIDEINRANISAVFGDLITLIESNKRLGAFEEMIALLPYSKKLFGVPINLQIVGSMNTADRSITLLDSALRRRFDFEEISPQPSILSHIEFEGINIESLLKKINNRINYFIGKDQCIGHSYFIGLANSETPKKDLLSIFINNIIPLLEEYFFNDVNKIRLVLGEGNKDESHRFYTLDEDMELDALFGAIDDEIDLEDDEPAYTKHEALYQLVEEAESGLPIEIFTKIYE